MGIDPGVARVGWAVVDSNGSRLQPLSFGCIETAKEKTLPARLTEVYQGVSLLIKQYNPGGVAVEDLFFATNAKTAIAVGQSRGVVLLAAELAGIPVFSYSPLAVKRAITGDGKADKKQVERMVVLTLKLHEAPRLDDTADALAIAMTHAYSYKLKQLI